MKVVVGRGEEAERSGERWVRERGGELVVVEEGRVLEEEGAGVIVVEGRWSHGVERVLRHARCPVLLARPEVGSGRILAATDFEDAALPAVMAGWEVTRARRGRLYVLHVTDLGARATEWMGTAFGGVDSAELQLVKSLEEVARDRIGLILARLGVVGEALAERGDAAETIVRVGERLGADLVIVGSHGGRGIRRVMLGSVAEEVARRSPGPVLVERPS